MIKGAFNYLYNTRSDAGAGCDNIGNTSFVYNEVAH